MKSRVFIFPKYFDAKNHKITITKRTLTKEVVAMQQEENLGALNDLSEEVRQDIDNLYIAIRELAARLEEKKNEPRLRIGFRT